MNDTASPASRDTLLLPQRGRRTSSWRPTGSALPADLLGQSADRLRILALLYAFVFFMAGFLPSLVFPTDRARLFASSSRGALE